jgi:hypothetical protein
VVLPIKIHHNQALPAECRDQCWEMYALIDENARDSDMPRQVQGDRKMYRPAGPITIHYGAAAVRVRHHGRALQRLAHVRATRGSHV